MNYKLSTLATTLALIMLQGCSGVTAKANKDEELPAQPRSRFKIVMDTPIQPATSPSRVREITGAMMPVTEILTARQGDWLKQQQVQLDIRTPTPMTAVIQKLNEQGINVTTDLPLDSYTYVGKINKTDAETALQIVLGSIGLDYQVNDARKLIVIKPLSSRTWYLNIGNRKSSYTSDGQTASSNANNSSASSSNATSNQTTSSGTPPSTSTGGNGSTPSASNNVSSSANTSGGGTGVASADDFWPSLSTELNNRLAVMIPKAMTQSQNDASPATMLGLPSGGAGMMPPLPQNMPSLPQNIRPQMPNGAAATANTDLYVKRSVGSFSVNPETGAVTVQAPHWLLTDFDTYIKRVQEMYNTDISFQGELVLVTSNQSNSEGFDLSAFASWAGGKYAAVISNNALGGITMSMPAGGGLPSLTAGAQSVAGPLVGFQAQGVNNAMNIFNAYLAEIGKVSVIQRPLITTTSGVPGVFSKKFTDYYNTVSQQAAAGGTGSAATATQNVLVPVELGTELRINPRIDVSTGLIRAQLTLNQAIQSGTKNIPQTITFGNNATTINTTIPLITRQNLSGEILLRDGDLVVVGGQTEDNLSADASGLPGEDGPLGGLLGVKKTGHGSQTYYFALRVSVSKRK